ATHCCTLATKGHRRHRRCFSAVGYVGGKQPLSLGDGCLYLAVAVHELLHALGFQHEHMRPDRDQHLKIMLDNVIPEYRDQFEKRKWSSEAVRSPFVITSVMKYGSQAFARTSSKPTILTKAGKRLPEVYEKKGLSKWDMRRGNEFYKWK
ncbi:hypothetical protein V5799_013222, partial [Amblyomma americanum]